MAEIAILLMQALLCALGGYGIGRTIARESIFEGLVAKIENFAYYPIDPFTMIQGDDGVIYEEVDLGDEIGTKTLQVLSSDGYRTDIPRYIAVPLGKLGDLVTCVTCASTNAAFCLYTLSVLFSVIPLTWVALFTTVGLSYSVLNLIDRLN